MYMDKDGQTLATEIFKELKASAKRWFIAFCIMCGIELATVAGFLWYISLPVDETTGTQDLQDINGDNISQNVGVEHGKNQTDSNTETESNTQ